MPVYAGSGLMLSNDIMSDIPQTVSVADNGIAATPASFTVTPSSKTIQISCADVDGCDATLGEVGVRDGSMTVLISTGPNGVNIFDTPGVSETTGAIVLGQYDSIEFAYAKDRWIQTSTHSNN